MKVQWSELRLKLCAPYKNMQTQKNSLQTINNPIHSYGALERPQLMGKIVWR